MTHVTRLASVAGRVVTIITALVAMYLALTALPAFLGLAGVLPGPAHPGVIADALARLFLAFAILAILVGAERF